MMLASKPKMLAITGICFLFVFIACNKSTDDTTPTPNDPVAAVLNLPASPFNYANPALPGYLSAPPIQVQSLIMVQHSEGFYFMTKNFL